MQKAIRKYFPIFFLPTLAAFVIGFLAPFIMGVALSFCRFTTVSDAAFNGVENYVRAFADETFRHAFWFTAAFAVVTLFAVNVPAFLLAVALTRELPGTGLFRTVFFLPNLIGGIVLGYIWQLIFDGVLSRFDLALKLSAKFGFWGLVILICWQQIGYMMIIYIAGLQAIPDELREAAAIDGANGWQALRHVTLPMMASSITICTFLTVTNSFKLFDQNLSLTAGEPAHRTEMLALNIFNTFYGRTGWEGVGQAKAVLFFVLVVGIGVAQLHLTEGKEGA